MNILPPNFADLLEELENCETSKEQFEFLLDLASEATEFDEEKKTGEYKLLGCASNAWMAVSETGGKVFVSVDAEGQISKGMLTFLSLAFSGSTKEEIKNIPEELLERNSIFEKLSPSRKNGFYSAVSTIRDFCNN